MLVVMALVTTMLTIPLLNFLGVDNLGDARPVQANAA
jgi:hypothetical protein